MIIARPAKTSDAPALKMLNELFNGEGTAGIPEIEASLKSNKQEIVCIATDADAPVGFCCGQITHSMCYKDPVGEVTELFVLKTHRRKGAATALMNLIESEFKARGVAEIKLLTGQKNKTAQAFYAGRGYEVEDEVLFVKENR